MVCFNRVARLVQRILQELCVLASNYFDDYPVLEFKQLAASSHSAVVTVASLLGFRLAQDKDEPAALCADLLGVTLDLSDDRLLEVRIANKKSRVAEMSKSLQTVLEEGKVVTSSLPAIFGRLQFCEGQLLEKKISLWQISGSWKSPTNEFQSLTRRLAESRPRIISASQPRPPALVFTDGSCEAFNDSFRGCVGGVLFVWGRGIWNVRVFGSHVL